MRLFPWHRWSVILLGLALTPSGVVRAVTPPTAFWAAESNQPGARMGAAVSAMGDVNGDGYSDLAVGLPGYDGGVSGQGRVAVYLGAAGGPALAPALTLDGGLAGGHFGSAVAFADVNGDGFDDLVVGAPDAAAGGLAGAGRVTVYPGSAAGLAATASLQLSGSQAGARFGFAVAGAGDVNGDGFADVIAGSPLYDAPGGTDAGRAQLYHGSASGLAATPAWATSGSQAGASLGFAVAGAGDVNGDGFADVIIGAPLYDNGEADEGLAQVFHGSAAGLAATPAWAVEGNQVGAKLGYAVAGAGDGMASGYCGVIVGAPDYDAGPLGDAGIVRLYPGSAGGVGVTAAFELAGSVAGARLGAAVAPAGDLNGDGRGDFLAGAPGHDGGQAGEGLVRACLMDSGDGWAVESDLAGAALGGAVAAGDVNGDGLTDVIAGAADYGGGQSNEGRVTLYLGAAGLPSSVARVSVTGGQAGALFGAAAAWVGDVNGDGFGDMVAGAPSWTGGQTHEGRANLYLGSADGLTTSSSWTFESNQAEAQLGTVVAGAGDVNGDGYADVLIGAPYYDSGQADEGRAYLFLGSAAGLASSPDWVYESNQPFALLGGAVAGAGDVNGDGFADVIVGAPAYNNGVASEGAAMVFLGSPSGLPPAPARIVSGSQSFGEFGACVAGVGDVNGDGFSDVLAGAPRYDQTLNDEGRVFVYLGSASGVAATPAWTAEGKQAGALFGAAAGAAGDVNGDGYGDLLVGASLFDNGHTDEGRAFVYLGSASGLPANPAWTAESNQSGARFGSAVASAGDVNGDGYGDLTVGAPLSSEGAPNEGRVSLYLGSAIVLPASANWTLNGNQAGAGLGLVLAGGGDGNGDGYSDLILGKPVFNNGEGAFDLFHGNGAAGAGVSVEPRQLRLRSAAPIAPLGLADDPLTFRVGAWGRSPLGRGKLRLEVEVKPLGKLFDGTGLSPASGWTDSGVAGAELLTSGTIPLDTAATVFHWRARLSYARVNNPLQAHGRWFTIPGGGWQMASLRMPPRGPAILDQPLDRNVFPGATATFTVRAAGPGTLTYQWRKNGAPLSDGGRVGGAQSATLRISSAALADEGVYTCLVGNGVGSVESNPASLTVVSRLLVDAAAPGPVRDGLSWATAFASVQPALTAAAANGVREVWVARGTYTGLVMLSSGIGVYGGFQGWSGARETSLAARDWRANETILNGGGLTYHVVVLDDITSATLDGFTVTGGNAVGAGGTNHSGGGIFCYALDSSSLIANCTIRANRAMTRGGGIFGQYSSPRFVACAVYGNDAADGAGVALIGGAPVFDGCVIAGNTASGGAGGLLSDGASPTLNACKLVGNRAQGGNGGALNCSHGGIPLLINGLLAGNVAAGDGGALESSWDALPALLNCTVAGNRAAGSGGGLALRSPAALANTILAGNNRGAIAQLDTAAITTLTACLFDANPDGDVLDMQGAVLNGADAINLGLAGAAANVSGPVEFVMTGGSAAGGSLTEAPVYDSLTGLTTLTDGAAGYTPGALAGQFINPNTGQSLLGLIVGNTATTLLVAGDLSGVCANGDPTVILDVRLRDGSAALDRALAPGAPATDLAGLARPGDDGKVDIGAYEARGDYAPAPDAAPPVSRVRAMPSVSTQAGFAVPFRASDAASGVASVRLYYRFNGGAWTQYGAPAAASPFGFSAPEGDGFYEFFTLATDASGNQEPPKSAAEASLTLITQFGGGRVYVDRAATGQPTGQDWTHALRDVDGAVILAAQFGIPEVWVARGSYAGPVTMRGGVAVYGGFEGVTGAAETALAQRNWGRNETVLDGGGAAGHVVVFNNISNAVLDGFTVTGGLADGRHDPVQSGGGILLQGAGVNNRIANCLVHDNRAAQSGGGIACLGASPTISACRIYANVAAAGGGVACAGGAAPVFDRCVIAGNIAGGDAGGLLCDGASPALNGCVLSGNESQGGYGGALSCVNAGPVLQNCILSGNTALAGGAVNGEPDACPVLLNCTVADNGGALGGGLTLGGAARLINTALRNNSGYAIVEMSGSAQTTLTACLFDANPDGDYMDKNFTDHTGAAAINGSVAGATLNVDGPARFAMHGALATTGTLTAPPAYDAATNLTTLRNDAAAFTPGALAGSLVNPDATQRRQGLVVGNTATTLLVAGDLTGLASAGGGYALVDYHPGNGSAALDRGVGSGTTSDLDGQLRPVDIYGQGNETQATAYDIGAYEASGPVLRVTSAHGSPVPPVGDHVFIEGTRVEATQGGIVAGTPGTRYLPLGFAGAGSAPASGAAASVAFAILGDSTLDWHWRIQRQLTAVASPAEGGRVTLADGITTAGGTWHDSGAALTVRAIPSAGWGLAGWSGDATGNAASQPLTMDAPRGVTAVFVQLPVIQAHPASLSVNQDQPASFTVNASGPAPLAYRWYRGGTPLADGGRISGSGTATLLIGGAQSSDAGSYSCLVTNPGGSVASNAATLTVNTRPVILAHPVAQPVNANTAATFRVTASGTAPLAYEWFKNNTKLADGGRISGATGATLTIGAAQKADEGNYHCRVSNSVGDAVSNAAPLTINAPPTITLHPAPLTADPGGTATFSVAASGTAPLSYQWRKDGVNIGDGAKYGGAATATLNVLNVEFADTGDYTCQVTNVAGSATSNAARLSVNPTLTIVSAHGAASPAVGTHVYPIGSTVTAKVTASPVNNGSGTRYINLGWKGTGAVAADGATSTVTFKIDRPTTIEWRWKTQYKLTATVAAPVRGSVTLKDGKTDANGQWIDAGAAVGVRAIPLTGHRFVFWYGDLMGDSKPSTAITMTGPRAIGAKFMSIKNAVQAWERYE